MSLTISGKFVTGFPRSYSMAYLVMIWLLCLLTSPTQSLDLEELEDVLKSMESEEELQQEQGWNQAKDSRHVYDKRSNVNDYWNTIYKDISHFLEDSSKREGHIVQSPDIPYDFAAARGKRYPQVDNHHRELKWYLDVLLTLKRNIKEDFVSLKPDFDKDNDRNDLVNFYIPKRTVKLHQNRFIGSKGK